MAGIPAAMHHEFGIAMRQKEPEAADITESHISPQTPILYYTEGEEPLLHLRP